jgi:eukaryotic-like serine/threonine-protein kinase
MWFMLEKRIGSMARGKRGRKPSREGDPARQSQPPKPGPSTNPEAASKTTDSVLLGIAAAGPRRPPPTRASQRLEPGSEIGGRFIVEALAAEGGMGVVYRAKDCKTGNRAAVKVMSANECESERFMQEGTVLAELAHPPIVKYIEHGIGADGTLYLAMEWLEGETLGERLERGPLSVRETAALALGAANGLGAAHARGIVHRDVKPSNLFLVRRDTSSIKLLDFGIARRYLAPSGLTHAGAMVGTVGYMAPEQAASAPDVDPRADVFALGCVLFICLTGRAAYQGANLVAVLSKLVLEDPPRLQAERRKFPTWMCDFVDHMLATGSKCATPRWQSRHTRVAAT